MEDVIPVSSLIFLQRLGQGGEALEKRFPDIAYLHDNISLGPHMCVGGGVNSVSNGACCSAAVCVQQSGWCFP